MCRGGIPAELVATRNHLISEIVGNMPNAHRTFLVSFERGQPDWSLLGLPNVESLPAVLWRQQNLDSIGPARRQVLVARLKESLGGNL